MEKIYQIEKDYSSDVEKFKEWFGADMEQVKKSTLNFNPITGLLRKVRMTPGIEEQIMFVEDIFNLGGLTIELININNVKPFSMSIPWQGRMRTTPFNPVVDKIFDYDLPARNCMFNLTLSNNAVSTIKWISQDVIITDEEKTRRDFALDDETLIPEGAFLTRGDYAVMYDNRFNDQHLFFVQVGFEGNPTFEEVKEKFKVPA